MSEPVWSSLSAEEHEFQYNPQKAFPDMELYRKNRERPNAEALAKLTRIADIPFGDHRLRKLDIYPAEGPGPHPVHVFFHGGYWRAQDKENFAFIAGTLVPLGITTVVVNYELCPDSTLDDVAASAIAGMGWIFREIGNHGGDPSRITISGHSAGAHLAAEILCAEWPEEFNLAGATLISGIFDPAPARLTTVNQQIRLTDEIIARRNVEIRKPRLNCPVEIVAGALEPWQWIDQSFRYFHHLHRHGYDLSMRILAGRNHFDILDDYLSPEAPLADTILRQTRTSGRN